MPGETTLKIMIDAELKAQAEALYSQLGTSFAEAIRIFAQQSVQEKALPFKVHIPENQNTLNQRIGIAKGKFVAPDDIDKYNDEITAAFRGL